MQDQNNKVERIALELNKTGLTYLSNQHSSSNAFDYFKKAQKMLVSEVQIDGSKKNIQSLLAVTYNNLAIYYKRTNKPKAALSYLKNALQIQTFILQDWLATATTHLNICAIYSFMGRHEQAVQHANLSIENANKAKIQSNIQNTTNTNTTNTNTTPNNNAKDTEKCCVSIELASMYNLAVEFQHLKKFQDAIQVYVKSRDAAKKLGRKNIQNNSQDGIDRLSEELLRNKKKLIELLQKKKENQEKGNYQSMRRNKKNFKSNIDESHAQQKPKYRFYDDRKRTQSVNKLVSLMPVPNSNSVSGFMKKQSGTNPNITNVNVQEKRMLKESNKEISVD